MGFVDHEDPVVGQHSDVARRCDTEHSVIGDDDVGLARGGAGQLGEALLVQRAGRAQTLRPRHRDVRPGAVAHTGDQIVAVAGGGLGGPLAQSDDLLPDAATVGLPHPARGCRRAGGEKSVSVIVGVAAGQPVTAQIVLPTFEQSHGGPHAGDGLDGVGRHRRILGHHLPLKGERRGGDHGPFLGGRRVEHDGHEVAQRLAGSGAGLHQQVRTSVERRLHSVRHLGLPRSKAPAEPADRLGERLPGIPVLAHLALTRMPMPPRRRRRAAQRPVAQRPGQRRGCRPRGSR